MKWIFYMIVFVLHMFSRAVYGLSQGLIIESDVSENDNYVVAGTPLTMSCKAPNKNQKVEWVNPSGKVVKHQPANRVFALEHFAQTRVRVPTLVLTFSHALVKDSGVWECRSGDLKKNTTLCIIDPSKFLDTQTDIIVDSGRSITLSCQATGEPEPRLLWYRNGDIISDDEDSSKYKIMTKFNSQGFEGLLTITSLNGEDSGVYTCEAIQEIPFVDDCTNSETMNITLQVNYAPKFEDENNTELVYGRNDESVNLVCDAGGFPVPTYRWFKEIGDVLAEFPKEQFVSSADGSQSILIVKANSSTFGQTYRCRATNPYGKTEKIFTILKLEKPRKPDEINFKSFYNEIELNVTWHEEILFPIDWFDIQYFKKRRVVVPREFNWKKGGEVTVQPDEESSEGILVTLKDLEENVKYWIRLRAVNKAGQSLWSDPILASTTTKPRNIKEENDNEDEEDETKENEEESKELAEQAEQSYSESTFYGIFFAGSIVVTVIACVFFMRMV